MSNLNNRCWGTEISLPFQESKAPFHGCKGSFMRPQFHVYQGDDPWDGPLSGAFKG